MAQLDVTLDQEYFGIQPNVPVMHQVVTAQLAKRRAGTQSTKTRSEVRGGGAKPYRQKGTGRARQGSTTAPHYAGGGVALGPKPRSYAQRTPKKMIKLALRSALSDRAADDKVLVVDAWAWSEPSTKAAAKALAGLGVEGRALVVLERADAIAALSFRNLPDVQLINVGELNAYDVLCNDWIVFTQGSLDALQGNAETAAVRSPVPSASAPDRSADDPEPASRAPASSRTRAQRADATESVTASAPDRSADEAKTGVASASEQPDASEASQRHSRTRATRAMQRSQ